MKRLAASILLLSLSVFSFSQTNMLSTNPEAEDIMLGNYSPADYTPTVILDQPGEIIQGILAGISSDSLKHYLEILSAFYNRNSGSDTLSAVKGIGASRRWVYEKFKQFGVESEGRLVPS